MKVVSDAEVERDYGISAEQLDAWDRDVCEGKLHGEPRGAVVRGRPLKFGQEMRQVGFKEPMSKVRAIDKRAAQLGMGRSDYLRHLVDEDLRTAGL